MKCICFYELDSNKYGVAAKDISDNIKSLLNILIKGNHYKSDINYRISRIASYNDYVKGISIESVDWELSGEYSLQAVCQLNSSLKGRKVDEVLSKVILDILNNVVYENGIDLVVVPRNTRIKESIMSNKAKVVCKNLMEGKSLAEAIKLTESVVDDDKVTALLQFLDLDPDNEANRARVGVESYGHNFYYIDDDSNDFLVCTDSEADEEHTQSIENFIDDLGVDGFTPQARDYILENFCDDDAIIDFYQDDMRSYAEDIMTEDDPVTISVEDEETGETKEIEVHNRLIQELLENNYMSESDFSESDFNEDGEYIGDEDLVEIWCDHNQSPEDAGYSSPYEWLEFNFGKSWANDFVKDHCDLDIEAVAEYVRDEDGRGNELNSWDGKEYEEDVNGETYYIYPNCDFERLDLKDAETDDDADYEDIDTGEE